MERDELLGALRFVGFSRIEVLEDDPHHPGGPALLLVAEQA
jgi:hypothetical protein